MIPKTIHYCWFGRNPLPPLAVKCIKSWKKFCPDYKIIEWNEDNFDISSSPLYVQQAYEAKKWAFVTDYVRLFVVYEHGGIYLDTDVELIKSLSSLLNYSAYFGFETSPYIATGLGFGAEKNASVLQDLMTDYNDIPFMLDDGTCDLTPCPVRNTKVLERYGLIADGSTQLLDGNIQILSSEWLCPYYAWSGKTRRTKNTISIHWYSASWETDDYQKQKVKSVQLNKKKRRRQCIVKFLYYIRYFPNRVLHFFLGDKTYNILKRLLKQEPPHDS